MRLVAVGPGMVMCEWEAGDHVALFVESRVLHRDRITSWFAVPSMTVRSLRLAIPRPVLARMSPQAPVGWMLADRDGPKDGVADFFQTAGPLGGATWVQIDNTVARSEGPA